MNAKPSSSRRVQLIFAPTALLLALVFVSGNLMAQSLTNDLVSHWPLDIVQGTKTPDVVSGYDMDLNNLTSADLVTGYRSNCFSFSNSRQTMLTRVHAPSDNLPINKHPALTIALWINAVGTTQPVGDLRFFSEANTGLSDPLFNLGAHSTRADNSMDMYLRQNGEEVSHVRTTGQPLDGTWHHIAFVQQADGSRTVYIDGMADPTPIPAKRAGITWNFNDTTIGGIMRTSRANWITGLIDEVAVWKRALSEGEVNQVRTNGVPRIGAVTLPLEIKSFISDFPAATQGDRITLRWDASKDATLSISPGLGDVTSISQFGVGSTNVAVNSNITFTLTATRGAESRSTQALVRVVSGVATNWRWVENFQFFGPGQGHWANAEGVFSALDAGTNRVLGYSGGDDLAAIRLNSLSVREGQSATLFFRTYIVDTASTVGVNLGLTERSIRFNDDFGANVGPFIRIERLAGATRATVSARNNVGGGFDPRPDVIEPGKVYNVWIDVENRPFNGVGGVTNGGDRFSVYIAQEGASNRTALFTNFVADRDGVTVDPLLGQAGTNLIYLFLSSIDAGQGDNQVLFDDFYLSSGGFNSTVPVPAGPFLAPLQISNVVWNDLTGFSFSWNSAPGKIYTINRKESITDPWTAITTVPSGGSTTTFNDIDSPLNSQTFYQVVENP